ncbi:MAG: hypothetical protein NC411_02590 [Bacteroides sp.]|nr:hypothetical protein [Bacteroides sp.]
MTTIDNSNIHTIINRFLDGETTLDEEKALYAFFKRPDLPPEAAPYREMFQWYASIASANATDVCKTDNEADRQSRNRLSALRVLPLRPWQWAGVAAMLALLLTIGITMRRPYVPEEYLSYEGSYIVRDGKKITDLNIVVPEIMRTEKLIDESMDAIDMSLDEVDNAFDSTVLSDYDLSDPDVKDIIYSTFDL